MLERLEALLAMLPHRLVACSGGVDSMLLATVAHRAAPETTIVAHAVSPAVPPQATERVRDWAAREGWDLRVIRSGEFADPAYLANPVNRCFHCKSHLYEALEAIRDAVSASDGIIMMSGANLDDLGEYRPGLDAAAEHGARHPFVEAGIAKADIRAIAHALELPFADLPASPCLASRLYTGTEVTADRLAAVDVAENYLRDATGLAVVRCRLRGDEMLIEVGEADRGRIDTALIAGLDRHLRRIGAPISDVSLDPLPYRPGRAFVGAQ
jgi:uncharacterized protein